MLPTLARDDPALAAPLLESGTVDGRDAYGLGLCWLGVAKARYPVSRDRYQAAFDAATNFFERTLIATASALAGWPALLAPALHAPLPTIRRSTNCSPTSNAICGPPFSSMLALAAST